MNKKYYRDEEINTKCVAFKPTEVSKEKLKDLKKEKIKNIDLYVQSSNDYVLKKCKAGYTFDDVKKASKLIRKRGFALGFRITIGLPESNALDDLNTAKDLVKLKSKSISIYPTLVFKNTELEKQMDDEEYEPLEIDRAVERCKEIMYYCNKKRIKDLKVMENEELHNKSKKVIEIVGGPYHKEFRKLVESSIYYDIVVDKIKSLDMNVKEVEIAANPQETEFIVGYENENIEKYKSIYGVDVKVKPDFTCPIRKMHIHVIKKFQDFKEDE